MDNNKTIYFAKYDYRGQGKTFGIKPNDRSRHVYVVGKTGMGKSTLLENMAVQDIRNGNGMAFIDPHGATAETLLSYVPEERIQDVIYFAPFDIDHPISFNVMEDVGYDKRHLVASGLMSAFKKIWQDAWSARMEYILTNTLLALLEYPDSTLIDVNKMLVDKVFRKKVVEYVQDPIVKAFWVEEFAGYTDRYTQEATPAIQNKIGQFVSNPLIRNIIGQKTSSFDFRKVMDEKKILIMNLSKGRMGDVNTQLLGSMLVIKIYLAAMSRADLSPTEVQKLPNFYFFVDEFQSFANETFADILSEARKYKLNLTIAHQYIEQMPEEVRDAVFGNVGTMIAFRVGAFDAEVLEKEFSPVFLAEDIVNLGFAQVYLKLMIDGLTSKPFSATTLPPLEHPETDHKEAIIRYTREHYAVQRAAIEEEIRGRSTHPVPSAASSSADKGAVAKAPPKYAPAPRSPETPIASGRENLGKEDEKKSVPPPRPMPSPAPIPRKEFPPKEQPRVQVAEPRAAMPAPSSPPLPPPRREAPPRVESHKPFEKAVKEAPRPFVSAKPREERPIPLQGAPTPPAAREKPRVAEESAEREKPAPMSLKMLQSNKKDTRSPEHLSALRQALSAVLDEETKAKESATAATPEIKEAPLSHDAEHERREPRPPRERRERRDRPPRPARVEPRPTTPSGEGGRRAVPPASARPPEIPENDLRKMLEVEE